MSIWLKTVSFRASVRALSFLASSLILLCATLSCPQSIAADERDDRVLVVFVFDKSCRISCDAVRPIFRQLKTEYGDKVKFVELDVSKDVLSDSQKTAKALNVKRFLDDTEDWYPAVGVFTGSRKKIKEILGAKPKEQYVQAIDKALAIQQKEGTTEKEKKAKG
ncbi:MAG TPA: thioredoxin [Candidatus Melainabacteria bacterium]|jgi:thiol-disulfide isomerase/thioredoxin|nr:thioredoxin [Candidatus Melainabacteria bacterium]